MAAIEHELPWTEQPQEAVRVSDRWEPVALFNFASGITPPNLGKRRGGEWTPGSANKINVGATGFGLGNGTSVVGARYGPARHFDGFAPANSPFWVAFDLDHGAFVNQGSSGNVIWEYSRANFSLQNVGGGALQAACGGTNLNSGALTAGSSYGVVFGRNASGACWIWVNGVLRASGSGATASDSAGASTMYASGDSTLIRAYQGSIAMLAFGSENPEAFGASLSANPWQLFAPHIIEAPSHASTGIPKRPPTIEYTNVTHEMPWTEQPQEVVEINETNPLYSELRFAFLGSQPDWVPNIKQGSTRITTGDPTPTLTKLGVGVQFSSGNYYTYSVPAWPTGETTPVTVVVLLRKTGTYQSNSGAVIKESVLGQRFGILANAATGVGMTIGVKSVWGMNANELAASSIGSVDLYIGTYDGIDTAKLYKNRVYQSSVNRGANGFGGAGTPQITVGVEGSDLTNRWLNGAILMGYAFSKLLSESEINSIFDDPYQLFKLRELEVSSQPAEVYDTSGYGVSTPVRPVIEHEMPWTEQPQEIAQVVSGVRVAINGIDPRRELASDTATTSSGTIGSAIGIALQYFTFGSGGPLVSSPTRFANGEPITLVAVGSTVDGDILATMSSLLGSFDAPAIRVVSGSWVASARGSSGTYYGAVGPAHVAGQTCSVVAHIRPGNSLVLVVDGVLYTTAFPDTLTQATPSLIGCNANGSKIAFVAALSGLRSDNELISISVNPWQLFKPRIIEAPSASSVDIPELYLPTLTDITTTSARPNVSVTF